MAVATEGPTAAPQALPPRAVGCPHQQHAAPQTSKVQLVSQLVEARLRKGGRLGRYTMAEVAQHNHKDSAWVVVDGKVGGQPATCCLLVSALKEIAVS